MPEQYSRSSLILTALVASIAVFHCALAETSTPPAVSITSTIPAEQRITPMPLKERIRLAAVPKRGMCSTMPALRAPDGLISGNGKMYVEVYGNPLHEQIVFHDERLTAPWKNGP